jgi:uncharacterized protein
MLEYLHRMDTLRYFRIPFLVSLLILGTIYALYGTSAFIIATLLTVLEVTLSFDNAVVNAKVLQDMDEVWRKRFLTWGILFAVVGTRFVLPIIIVAITATTAPWDILKLALDAPDAYGQLLAKSDIAIKAFGGMFLAMVALKYFVDDGKTIHWVRRVEHYLARLGSIESAEILIGLGMLLAISFLVPAEVQSTVLVSGLVGVILFLLMEGISHALALVSGRATLSGFALFLYLNVLDAAFSLDGVVGAFALTHDLIIIAVGLGIGAYLVRSMTLYFVHHGTLQTIRYLEHGAHWAIFGLALTMLLGLLHHIPEVVSGLIGLIFVAGSYYSSLRHIR